MCLNELQVVKVYLIFIVYGKIDTLLSEGIMAEIFLWSQIKNKKATFIPNIYGTQMVEII